MEDSMTQYQRAKSEVVSLYILQNMLQTCMYVFLRRLFISRSALQRKFTSRTFPGCILCAPSSTETWTIGLKSRNELAHTVAMLLPWPSSSSKGTKKLAAEASKVMGLSSMSTRLPIPASTIFLHVCRQNPFAVKKKHHSTSWIKQVANIVAKKWSTW